MLPSLSHYCNVLLCRKKFELLDDPLFFNFTFSDLLFQLDIHVLLFPKLGLHLFVYYLCNMTIVSSAQFGLKLAHEFYLFYEFGRESPLFFVHLVELKQVIVQPLYKLEFIVLYFRNILVKPVLESELDSSL
jgi:hypothetical protein